LATIRRVVRAAARGGAVAAPDIPDDLLDPLADLVPLAPGCLLPFLRLLRRRSLVSPMRLDQRRPGVLLLPLPPEQRRESLPGSLRQRRIRRLLRDLAVEPLGLRGVVLLLLDDDRAGEGLVVLRRDDRGKREGQQAGDPPEAGPASATAVASWFHDEIGLEKAARLVRVRTGVVQEDVKAS
jgi:hypothetical protein